MTFQLSRNVKNIFLKFQHGIFAMVEDAQEKYYLQPDALIQVFNIFVRKILVSRKHFEKKTLCNIEAFKSQVLSVLSKHLLFCGDLLDIGQMDKSRILYDISYLYFFLFGYLLSYVYLFLIYMFSYLDLSTPMFT